MKFQYEDVKVVIVDEISMVGAMTLAKINYRLQELADGSQRQQFMGGVSFIASGKFPFIKIDLMYRYTYLVNFFLSLIHFQVIFGNCHLFMIVL